MPWTRLSVDNMSDAADKLAEFLTRPNRAGAVTPNGGNTGNGTVFGASSAIDSVVEDWTLVCTTGGGNGVGIFSVTGSVSGAQAEATVGVPYFNGVCSFTILGGTVDFTTGTPDDFTFGIVSDTENWEILRGHDTDSVLGSIQPSAVTPGANTGNGTLGTLLTINSAVEETWTITATSTGPTATFSVVGSVSGGHTEATSATAYSNGLISFTISDGATPYIIGDDFTFTTDRTNNTVIANAANTGNGTVGSMEGNRASTVEQTITLNCITPGGDGVAIFDVDGSISGDLGSDAIAGTLLDLDEFQFLISAGGVDFSTGDKFTFQWRTPQYIFKGIGGGSDEIIVGIQVTDFKWDLQGFTGYVESNEFSDQPAYETGVNMAMTDGTFDILIVENARRFIVIPIIGATYAQCYLGWILPVATPSQWDYPMFRGGDSGDAWWADTGNKRLYNNALWDDDIVSWPYDIYTIHKTEDDELPLIPILIINPTSGNPAIYGEAEGCFYMDADEGALTVSDSIISNNEFYFVSQNVNDVGNNNLMALRLE